MTILDIQRSWRSSQTPNTENGSTKGTSKAKSSTSQNFMNDA